MIQKRYEYYSKNSIEWSKWYNYSDKDWEYEALLRRDEGWQLKGKLRNQYRIVKTNNHD